MIVKNFSYQSKEPIFLSVALIEAENLVIKEDSRSQKYRKTKFLDQNSRSFAHLRNFLMVIEDAFIEVEIDQIRLDGILIPTRFDLLPDNARNDMTMDNLVIRQIAGDRTASPSDMFFQSLNSDHLTIDMDLSWEQEKQDNLLTFKNQLNLYAHDLFRLNAGLQMLFTQKEYDHLNQLTLALMEDANRQTEEALNIAAVQAITDLSISLTDTGALSVYNTSQGERGAIQRNVFLSMMQLALLESVPAHAQAISGPVSDFLETGGTLSMQSKITPPLSAAEMMQLPDNIDLFLDRIGFIIRHSE